MIDVPFDSVREVYEDFHLSFQLHEIFNQVQGQRAADLIGKYVQGFAIVGDSMEFVEGRVDSVAMMDGVTILYVGNQQLVFPRDVFAAFDSKNENLRLIGSTAFRLQCGTDPGEVTGVEVRKVGENNHLFIRFENGSTHRVQVINHVTDALTYVHSDRPFNNSYITNGTVESITMRGGIPFLNVRVPGEAEPRQVDFLAYISERTGREMPSDMIPDTNNNTTTQTPPPVGASLMGSEMFTHGKVTDFAVASDGSGYLEFDDGTDVFVSSVAWVESALSFGKSINHTFTFVEDDAVGKIVSVTIRDGKPFLNVLVDGEAAPREVDFMAYSKADSTDGGKP
jgi:hypothetical protein